MNESAISTRERRKAETARGLREAARRLTIERGLSGFTVEELCEEVGVSRRTLFNYYASKENAVIGIPVDLDESGAAERFLAEGPRGIVHLLDDLIALHLARWDYGGLTAADIHELLRAVDREPRLAAHMLKMAGEGEREDILLVERREGLPRGDLRAAAAVQLAGGLLRASAEEFFRPETSDDLPDIIRRRIAAVRELFA
ncbi:TetR family transcriptional regulator [Leifsonia sp. ZF2019]|uniref:TetR/AcrR family transcriptional regulator n=1 Tax=Leifsonia sp. ZF2019 TaxID=2781978 RepID=UPI001CBF3309|nr:TetR/AcrR family transcriptional regulator [Leifsonia sp. ZF2019]UAJ80002.1 TetR family transcriptional regulator [Leifsonia sp. ZF2019]